MLSALLFSPYLGFVFHLINYSKIFVLIDVQSHSQLLVLVSKGWTNCEGDEWSSSIICLCLKHYILRCHIFWPKTIRPTDIWSTQYKKRLANRVLLTKSRSSVDQCVGQTSVDQMTGSSCRSSGFWPKDEQPFPVLFDSISGAFWACQVGDCRFEKRIKKDIQHSP
jgi:hypothetical protein